MRGTFKIGGKKCFHLSELLDNEERGWEEETTEKVL